MIKPRIILIVLLILMHAGPLNAGTVSIDGTSFAATYNKDELGLHLKGAALLRYLVFIKAYAGALYLPDNIEGSQALADIPKHLILEYRVDISAPEFAKATSEKIKDSVSREAYEQLEPKIQRLNQLYKDVESGDCYSLTYVPGKGTTLTYNAIELGTIEGYDFSKAVFSIWIGDAPIDKGFRDKLLGRI